MNFYCDNSLAQKILKWKSVTDIDSGLKKTINWYSEMEKKGKLRRWMI